LKESGRPKNIEGGGLLIEKPKEARLICVREERGKKSITNKEGGGISVRPGGEIDRKKVRYTESSMKT